MRPLFAFRAKKPLHNEARPRERSVRGRFLPLGKKASSYRGAYRVPLFYSSVGMCGCVCVTFVVFTDCESHTRPISTNPGSMESGEYGLTRETCFLACRLELDAVAGLLWISWCVSGGADFSVFFFRFFFLRTHTACCKYEATSCLVYLSTSTGVRTGCHYLICRSVFVCACDIKFVLFYEADSLPLAKKIVFIPVCVQGAII